MTTNPAQRADRRLRPRQSPHPDRFRRGQALVTRVRGQFDDFDGSAHLDGEQVTLEFEVAAIRRS